MDWIGKPCVPPSTSSDNAIYGTKEMEIVDFLPNKSDAGFQIRAEKGLITINQMFDGETLKSFKQLQDKYGLCSKDFYRYLQLRDFVLSHIEWNALKNQPSPLENFLIKCTVKRRIVRGR